MGNLWQAKLEIDVEGQYKVVSNISSIDLEISYLPKASRSMHQNDWSLLHASGGTMAIAIIVRGIVSDYCPTNEVRLSDILFDKYFVDTTGSPTASSMLSCKLTLTNGRYITAECTVKQYTSSLTIGTLESYTAVLNGGGPPSILSESN